MPGTWHRHHYKISCKTMSKTWHHNEISCKTIAGLLASI
ncbi:hypothetical protein F383_12541 [Gossypium arboreum]|uniref:Uncharacterized protein n=1 Tax=Gossypium arboreum TaxID=29729 RepID=A0A0B0N643_GOSAR|nr:hypothetical protein F383_12541 [Gossypium arboreum]